MKATGKKLFTVGSLALAVCLAATPLFAEPPQSSVGFNGAVSGFPTGTVSLSGGGAYNLSSNFASLGGGFSCLESVLQGPLSVSINTDDPGACLTGQGVRWDTAELLPSTTFKCSATDTPKTATTSDTTVVLEGDFYRHGDGNDESFHAKMIVSDTDLADNIPGLQNLWVEGVGCGTAIVNFRNNR